MALLATLAVLPFLRVLGFDFVTLDDPIYVQHNPLVLRGLTADGVRWAFTSFHATNWHPLTWLSHMLDASLFGPGPVGPHAFNVLLHAVNTLLLFAVLASATGAALRSAFVAALFAVHPLHVESVAWISERKDVLSTCFWFASTLVWIRWTRRPSGLAYVAALVLFALALLAKPMPVTLPFTLLLLDAWPLRRLGEGASIGRRVFEKTPFFVLSCASAFMTWKAQSAGAASTLGNVGLGERVANAIVSYASYLGEMLIPARLSVLDPHPALAGAHHPAWKIALSAAVIVAISVTTVAWMRKRPWLAWGWCWYLGTLVPVIGLVQVGEQAMADRYTYVPLVGVFVALVWTAGEMVETRGISRRASGVAAGAVLLVLGVLSWVQTSCWRNGITLFERCVAVSPQSALAWASLGDAQVEQGGPAQAVDAYRRALAIDDGEPRGVIGLGIALARGGRANEALPLLERGVRLRPSDANAWYNLGAVRGNLGRHDEARQAFEQAVALAPDDPNPLAGLSFARRALGDRKGAVEAAERLKRIDPRRGAEVEALVKR
jgi:tetratricopeptide (TPR) repeat protein